MQVPEKQGYTYEDYYSWNDGKRYELIDGKVYMMSPAPSPAHQEICVGLVTQLYNYLRGKTCKVYPAPFDVRLNADAEDNTVVQPDITIVCDPSKIDSRACKGVPDMVVEILSPSTAKRDQLLKYNKYRDAGVLEYWVVNPDLRTVMVYTLKDGQYVCSAYGDSDNVKVGILDDCQINFADVFPPAPPDKLLSPDIPPWEEVLD